MRIMPVRFMRHFHRSIGTVIAIVVMPVAFMLLFVYVLGSAILTLEEILLAVIGQKSRTSLHDSRP